MARAKPAKVAKPIKLKRPKAPSWDDLRRRRRRLLALRPSDGFMRSVLKGVFRTGRDNLNPIRGNLCAGALRELISHVLHGLAPNTDVVACGWYAPVPKTMGPTRRQRAQFITHAGLAPGYVSDALGIDPDETIAPLLEAMDRLNGLTHVREGTILYRGSDVRRLCGDAMDALSDLLGLAADCRAAVEEQLRDHLDEAVMERMIEESIQELDELSTHTTIDEHQVEEIEVVEIGPELITLSVSGTVFVTLQYGSNSDVRNDIGALMDDNYPYTAEVQVKTANPTEIVGQIEVRVDNTSFYE